jgi:branched-chain amino acid transport system permease protein
LNTQIVINILISFSLYVLIAFQYQVMYISSKVFHVAHGAVITLGAYFMFSFFRLLSLPFPLAVIIATLLTTLVGMACEVFIYRPLRKKKAPSLTYLIASIGLYVALQNCISLFWGDDTRIINTSQITVGNEILGGYITNIQAAIVSISFLLFVSMSLFLRFTMTGKSIRAVASNPELCNIYGISSNRIILIAFGIGSALAAIVGIMSAMDTNMTPIFGFNLLLYGVVAMIIGGIGSTAGLIGGALLVATAQHLAAYYIDTKWMDAVTYLILILFLIWKPLGFSGKPLKKVEV